MPESAVIEGQEYQINVKGNVIGFSSTVLVDADTETITAEALTGHATIDVTGSISGLDSSVIIDAENNSIFTNLFNTNNLEIQKPTFSVDPFEVKIIGNGGSSAIRIVTKNDNNLTGTFYSGKLWFGYEDPTGSDVTSGILGGEDALYFVANASSDFTSETSHLTWLEPGKLGIGTYTPAYELDVRGNAVVTGSVTAAAFNGSVFADDSSVMIDAINRVVTADSFVSTGAGTPTLESATNLDLQAGNAVRVLGAPLRLANLDSTQRTALTPANGDLIYNTTANRIQAYQNGAWINLDDGTAA